MKQTSKSREYHVKQEETRIGPAKGTRSQRILDKKETEEEESSRDREDSAKEKDRHSDNEENRDEENREENGVEAKEEEDQEEDEDEYEEEEERRDEEDDEEEEEEEEEEVDYEDLDKSIDMRRRHNTRLRSRRSGTESTRRSRRKRVVTQRFTISSPEKRKKDMISASR